MLSHDGPIRRHDLASQRACSVAGQLIATTLAHEFVVLARGHKTNLLAVFFLRHVQAKRTSNLTNGRFVVTANRQQHPLQELLLDAKQHIRLVLARINTTRQSQLTIVTKQLSVMTRRQKFGVDRIGVVKQLAELDAVVAHHARVRSTTDGVFVDKVINDVAEFFF